MSIEVRIRARRAGFALEAAFATEATAVGVTGPSGSGKSTLLQAIAGLAPVEHARVLIQGRVLVDTDQGLNPPAHRRRIGLVFQDSRLFPHLSVAGNVAFGARYAADPLPVDAALALVDMTGFGARRPHTLSGGEVRRVAIARALAARPRLLLLDEPFTGLDGERRETVLAHLIQLRDELRIPMILVSHHERDIEVLCGHGVRLVEGRTVGPAPG